MRTRSSRPGTIPTLLLTMTLAAAASLPAAETPRPSEPTDRVVAPGLVHRSWCRGEAGPGQGFRLLLGVFELQSEADALLARLEMAGLPAQPESDGVDYQVVSPVFEERAKAEELARRLSGQALAEQPRVEEVGGSITNPAGPWRIQVLEADPGKIDVRVAHAYDAAIGLETTADLARRRGAIAAINGGYFRMKGLLAGDSQGVLRIDGELLSEPDRGRAAVGFYRHEGRVRSVFGRLAFSGSVHLADGGVLALGGINRPRSDSELILFTPELHRTTLTPPGGAEIVIEKGRISEIRTGKGSSLIPAEGQVLSIGPDKVAEVLPRLQVGEPLRIETELRPLMEDPRHEWEKTSSIVGGGPLLLWKGERLEEPDKESISRSFFLARHPRTAIGTRADGTLVLVTVDGRRPGESVGMSIPELTGLMLELGCTFALNLDGGGSTTMVVDGEIVNRPSGSKPRQNADAILLFPASR